MFFDVFWFLLNSVKRLSISDEQRKEAHSSKNKTHEKLTAENLFDISLPVTKITVFETSEGIGERSRETLGENNGRAVCSCYDAPR